MILLLLSFLGGVLTILSPCILPVLPFVFARADRPFLRSGLPMLLGMALTFAGVATLATVGGGWVVQANQAGRALALLLFAGFGLMLLLPRMAERATAPLVALGNRLSNSADTASPNGSVAASLLLGVATGLLWAPCAGPILGLLLTTAAIEGASAGTTFLLLAYALGASVSLGVALLAGGRMFAALKRSLGAGETIRRVLGVAVLAGAGAIALGLDTGLLTRLSTASTQQIEQSLLSRLQPQEAQRDTSVTTTGELASEGALPPLTGGAAWLNAPPLTREALRGKVVLIDFWTYSCINCLRTLPYVRAWADKYRGHGLVVIGVHSPEFAFERDESNVRRAVRDLGVDYPVVLDNSLQIWRAFNNRYWPAHYFADAQGQIRHHQFGEGGYAESERVIQQLLAEAGNKNVPGGLVNPDARGVGVAAAAEAAQSPETYVGYGRRTNFVSAQRTTNAAADFSIPTPLQLNQWAIAGSWTVTEQSATLHNAGGAVRFRFHARDLHLVMAPAANGRPVRFRVTVDGAPPGAARGMDIDASGAGVVRQQRLYQLVRGGPVTDRTFDIEFLDPGVQVFAFTFG